MKFPGRFIIIASALILTASAADAQQKSSSTLRKRDSKELTSGLKIRPDAVTARMQRQFEKGEPHDADLQWLKVVYRRLDDTAEANATLFYPEEYSQGEENLFRIILSHVADGSVPAYEYLDGRESFDESHRLSVADMLDRFHIPANQSKGNFEIAPEDVPASEVKSYFIIERWEFNARDSRTRTAVDAICPVLYRSGEFDEELRFPMMWVKMDDLRPYMAMQQIFVDNDNNLARYTYDDFFTLNMYDGEIYKTRNLANKSMAQLYPDSTAMRHAQDSIDLHLRNFDKKLWVPSREEVIAAHERREAAERGDSVAPAAKKTVRRSSGIKRKPAKVKSAGTTKPSNSSALRSVRRRK